MSNPPWSQYKGLINGLSDDNHYRSEIEKLQKIIGKQAIQVEILKKNGRATGDKIEAVEMLKGLGYKVKDDCIAVGISRSSYYLGRRKETTEKGASFRDRNCLEKIKEIKT